MSYFRREYVLFIINGIITMISGSMSGPFFAPYVKEEFTAPLIIVGIAVSGYFLLRTFSELPFGVIFDRVGPKKPLLIGKIFSIVASYICWITTDVYQLVAARALWGMGDAAFFCVATVWVASIFPDNQRGRALGIFTAVEWIGSLLGQSLSGFAATSIGIRNIFLVNTILGFISLVLLMRIRIQKDTSDIKPGNTFWPSRSMIKSAISSSVIIASIMILSISFRSGGVVWGLFPLYVTEQLGVSYPEYGILTAVSTGGSALGMVFGGIISDRFGKKRVIALGFGIGVIATYLLTVVNNFLLFIPVMLMDGLSFGIIYSVTPALVLDSVPNNVRGIAIGLYRTFFDFGGLIGPIVTSTVVEIVGVPYGYITSFYINAILMFSNLLLVTFLKYP